MKIMTMIIRLIIIIIIIMNNDEKKKESCSKGILLTMTDKVHWASKETYHFFRATLTKIQSNQHESYLDTD